MANTVPEISIIIPTLNEEEHIGELIRHLSDTSHHIEIIVADGSSRDQTRVVAEREGAKVICVENSSRPKQLNVGADLAKAPLLYFVHADTLPPKDYARLILAATADGRSFGSFRFKCLSTRQQLTSSKFLLPQQWR